MYYRGIP
jgi:hypothetical protein